MTEVFGWPPKRLKTFSRRCHLRWSNNVDCFSPLERLNGGLLTDVAFAPIITKFSITSIKTDVKKKVLPRPEVEKI